ncbi:MAG: nucleotidyltransferase family protein [Deltaproteobacteria bacterium]|nr:nucleotidyltransferase family protein [Deltaproteobacteria bacterium]
MRGTQALNPSADVRRVVLALASGLVPEPGICSEWTTDHLKVVRAESVSPWLYISLKDHTDVGLDPAILADLRQDYRASAIRVIQREAALRQLLVAFDSHGIPLLLLKGAYLGRFVYNDPALRPMLDLDLLVRDEHFEQACEELERLGYRLSVELDPEEERLLKLPRVYGYSGSPPEFIDLHRCIRSMGYYELRSDILWDNAIEGELYGCRVFYLSPELNFIHLALHNLNHRGDLRDWVDLVLLMRALNPDWDRLIALARSLGVMRPLFWIFHELSEDWETRAPADLWAALASYTPRPLEDRVIRGRFAYFWRVIARIERLDGWSARARYLRKKLAAPVGQPDTGSFERLTDYLRSKVTLFRRLWRRG